VRAGDLVRIDFGLPIGSEPGFERPAVVVTADAVLDGHPRMLHVVPITTNTSRNLPTEILLGQAGLSAESAVQCHLLTVIARERIVSSNDGNIGPAALAQIRSVVSDLLDLG
jgi:mRNA interferase MazF